jgi:hypothetical protein
MQLKFAGADAQLVRAAAEAIAENSKKANSFKKKADAAKEVLTKLLAEKRDIHLDRLQAKTVIIIQADDVDAVQISRKGREQFDKDSFSLLHGDLLEKFTGEVPATYFDSLL